MNVITLILHSSGALHLASDKISTADAERWVEEGKTVFRLVASKGRWVVNHVNTGRVISDAAQSPDADATPALVPLLLTLKEETT